MVSDQIPTSWTFRLGKGRKGHPANLPQNNAVSRDIPPAHFHWISYNLLLQPSPKQIYVCGATRIKIVEMIEIMKFANNCSLHSSKALKKQVACIALLWYSTGIATRQEIYKA